VSGRGKLGIDMREIWTMQPRFEKRVGSGPYTLIEQPRFRAGLDFLRLRAHVGEVDADLAAWWERFSLATEDERSDMMQAVRQQAQPRAARVRGRGKADADTRSDAQAPAQESGLGPDQPDPAQGVDEAAPRKRRRRRRSRSDGSGGDEGGNASAPPPTDGPG
jgi:poly(A) polymerase